MATSTFVRTTVDSSNPLARFDESVSAEQWSMGADSADAGKFKICNTADLTGTCAVEFDGTTADFGGDVNVAGNLDVAGTISGNINVSLSNPIVSGTITSLGTSDITINACDLNLAAQDGRVIDSISGDGTTVTVDLVPTATISGNSTTAWGIPTATVNVNLQGTGNGSVDNVVFNATIVSASQFTFASTETVFAVSDPYVFVVNDVGMVNGCGLFLRAEDGGVNADKTLTYDEVADQWNSNIGVNFTDNTDVISFADNQVLSNTEVGNATTNMGFVYTEAVGRSTAGTFSVGHSGAGGAGDVNIGAADGDIVVSASDAVTVTASGGDAQIFGVGARLQANTNSVTIEGEMSTTMTANTGNVSLQATAGSVNLTAADNSATMTSTQTTFNSGNEDVIFQVRGETNDNLIHVDPSNVIDTLTSDGTLGGPFQSITQQVTTNEYEIVLGNAFPNITVEVGTLVTVAGTAGGTFDIVDAPVLSFTSQTQFIVDYGSDLGAGPAPPQLGATISTTQNEEAVGIGRVPNDGVSDTPGEFILDINGSARGTAFMATSDRTFKDAIETISPAEGLALVKALRPVRHDWRVAEFPDRKFSSERQVGFIAQEVREVVPEVVSGKEGGMAVDYAKVVPVLIAAVQDLSQQVADLKAQLDAKQ